MSAALFEWFPALRERIPWMSLATLPTPIDEMARPPGFQGRLFVKRDDLTSSRYGGNKIRKFEHVLADARQRGVRALVTVGGIGSNQALAAAIHGRALGLEVEVALGRQPVTDAVRRNLAGMLAAGARVRYAGGLLGAFLTARAAVWARRRSGQPAAYIPLGATNRLGTAAYVGAALELAGQVRRGECPPPDRIFVAAGTGGTAAGLLVGCRMAGLAARVTVVRAGRGPTNAPFLVRHARRAAAMLARLDPAVPHVQVGRRDFDIEPRFAGPGYGVPTPEANAAVAWASPALSLETTYTGKALAACLLWCRTRGATGTILFWNTHNAAAFPLAADLRDLPDRLQALLSST
jgi:1-aminocyclopropane-1-carboxylate deaminase/D-cysteine desulfhydrase-like pyridoxal-dependent ACC family enzyme